MKLCLSPNYSKNIFCCSLCLVFLCVHFAYAEADSCPYGYCSEEVAKSIQELDILAKSGDVTAQYQLGGLLFEDVKAPIRNGVKSQQILEAEYWLKKAADSGLDKAQYLLGKLYASYIYQDDVSAFFWYKKAAEQGYAQACRSVGQAYFNGIGVTEDTQEGMKWITKAAEQGDFFAQRDLALKYRDGSIPRAETKAAYWLLKLAERGDKGSMYSIADYYESGVGVEQNDAEALHWYRKVSEQGHAIADDRIGVFYENGRGGTIQNYLEAIKWYKKSGERGYGVPYYRIGLLFESGKGVKQNYSQAIYWYSKSLEIRDGCGDEHKATHLARLYENGLGVAKDIEKAKKLYQFAEQKALANNRCSGINQ